MWQSGKCESFGRIYKGRTDNEDNTSFKNGRLKESMSFENIDYQEVFANENWTESRLYELFSSRFLFVVFKETDGKILLPSGKEEPEYKLEKVAFWTMPQSDLRIAEEYWENIRKSVVENHISAEYFGSRTTTNVFMCVRRQSILLTRHKIQTAESSINIAIGLTPSMLRKS